MAENSQPPRLLRSKAGRALTLALAALAVLLVLEGLARLVGGGDERYYHTRLLEHLAPGDAARMQAFMDEQVQGFEQTWKLGAAEVLDAENFVLDEELVYRLKPNLDLQAINFTLPAEERERARWHYNANAEGWRGPLTHPKPEGVRRVVVLGDSTSYGWGLSEEESWPAQLQQYLGEDWEVYNRAVPGYTSYQGEVLARTELEKLQPDYVTISYGANDAMPYPLREEEVAAAVGTRLNAVRSVLDRLALPRVLARWLAPTRELTRRVPPAEYSERLREIAQATANAGGKPILLDICETDPAYTEQAHAVASLLPIQAVNSRKLGVQAHKQRYVTRFLGNCPIDSRSDSMIYSGRGAFSDGSVTWDTDEFETLGPPPRYFADKCHPNKLGAKLVASELACHIWGQEHPMTERSFSLEHTLRRPDERSEGKPPVLIALHGIGSNDKDLIGLQPFLDPRLYVIAARAPHDYAFPGGYSWFDLGIDQRTGEVSVDIQQIEQSRDKIIAFIDEVIAAYDVDPQRVFLMGFSQGSMMSYTVLAKAPEKIAGIVAMSGRFVPELFEGIDTERIKDFPILVTHGTLDEVLPISNGRAAKEALEKLPVKLTYKEYPMAHEVSQASIGDVSAWLKQQLGQ